MTDERSGLDVAAIDALLRRPILARIGLVDRAGWPTVVPVWIDWDGETILIIARARSRFVADLRSDPRVCVSVVDDRDPDRRVQLFGRARFLQEPGPLAGDLLDVARRMAEQYEGPAGVAYIERSRGWDRVAIRVVPDRIVSWGSSEWHPRYLAPSGADPAPPSPSSPPAAAKEGP